MDFVCEISPGRYGDIVGYDLIGGDLMIFGPFCGYMFCQQCYSSVDQVKYYGICYYMMMYLASDCG